MSATEQQTLSMIGEDTGIDWSGCDVVEVIPGKVSGAPILKNTRVPADFIVDNYLAGSPFDEIVDNFAVDPEAVREILQYAATQRSDVRL